MSVQYKHISVEGIIGTGKTEFAIRLKDEIGGRLVLDENLDNPFFDDSLINPQKTAFQNQIFLLINRYKQQELLDQLDIFHSRIICDYLFERCHLYSSLILTDRDMALYQKIEDSLLKETPIPDFVIFLQQPFEVTLSVVKQKYPTYYENMGYEFIKALDAAYHEFIFKYSKSPSIVIDVSKIDLTSDNQAYTLILDEMKNHKGGMRYFSVESQKK